MKISILLGWVLFYFLWKTTYIFSLVENRQFVSAYLYKFGKMVDASCILNCMLYVTQLKADAGVSLCGVAFTVKQGCNKRLFW